MECTKNLILNTKGVLMLFLGNDEEVLEDVSLGRYKHSKRGETNFLLTNKRLIVTKKSLVRGGEVSYYHRNISSVTVFTHFSILRLLIFALLCILALLSLIYLPFSASAVFIIFFLFPAGFGILPRILTSSLNVTNTAGETVSFIISGSKPAMNLADQTNMAIANM